MKLLNSKSLTAAGIFFLVSLLTVYGKDSAAQKYVIKGKLTNGSREDAPIGKHGVVLNVNKDGQEVKDKALQATTDIQGNFKFTHLDESADYEYYPSVIYQGIEYFGPAVKFSGETAELTSNVVVYDTTSSDENIRVAMEHLILEPTNGVLLVKELYLFHNNGKKTYVGNQQITPDKRATLQFPLPENYMNLQLESNLMSCCVVTVRDRLFDTMEFKPGIKRIAYTYQLKYSGPQYVLNKSSDYDVVTVNLFVPQSEIQVQGPRMVSAGDFTIRSQRYMRYVIEDIKKGSTIAIHLSNLPTAPRDYRWLVLVAVGLIFLVGFFYSLIKRRSSHPENKTDEENISLAQLEYKREEYLAQIAILDDQFEEGLLKEEEYRRLRNKLKAELLQVTKMLKVQKRRP